MMEILLIISIIELLLFDAWMAQQDDCICPKCQEFYRKMG